jgi:Zn-dependent M28 family amino/carboxypeptidase
LLRRDARTRSTSASGTITRAAATELLTAVDGQAVWLDALQEDGFNFHATDAEVALSLRIREESAAVPNVIAWLEGSDPQLKDEYIVIGAHLDHLGERSGNVYYGADDNGSGSTAILSIARALALNSQRPKRSVLFIWFAAEEMGLVGSRHYTDFPTLPLEKMVCMLNIDMVGRNEEKEGETAAENEKTLHLIGSQQGQTTLHEIILAANRHVNFTFEYDEEGVFGRSDQASFYNKGIAVAFLFGGFHPDYHQPSDELARIDFDKISSAARLFYLTAFGAAEHGRIAVTPPAPQK